jgi:hypothetical protein
MLFPTRLAFQHIRLLHQVCYFHCGLSISNLHVLRCPLQAFHVLQYRGVARSSRSLPRRLRRCFQRVPCANRSCDTGKG